MTPAEWFILILAAIVGGPGLVGLAFGLLRRYIDKKLTASEEEAKKRRDTRIKRRQIDDELCHAYGRLFFWLYRAVVTGNHNGALDTAFNALESAEEKKRCLDREVRAESEQDGYS